MMNTLPILVVEDEPDGQELVTRLLSQLNLSVHAAGTAREAWDFLMQQAYSLAIIDLALPEQDGFELVAAIRNQPEVAALPCIAMTAFHTPELRLQAIQGGFNAYFAKPLDRTRFLAEVDRILGN